MNHQKYDKLREEIAARALFAPRPTQAQLDEQKEQARRLGAFIQTRLDELQVTPEWLAQQLDIDREFVDVVVTGALSPRQLTPAMFDALAEILECDPQDLQQGIQANK